MSLELLSGVFIVGPLTGWLINVALHHVVPVLVRHGWR